MVDLDEGEVSRRLREHHEATTVPVKTICGGLIEEVCGVCDSPLVNDCSGLRCPTCRKPAESSIFGKAPTADAAHVANHPHF